MRIGVLTGALAPWPPERILNEVAAAGAHGVEVLCGPDGQVKSASSAELAAFRASADRAGLTIIGVAAPPQWTIGRAEVKTAVEIAAGLGAPHVRVFAPSYSPNELFEHQLTAVTTNLDEMVRQTAMSEVAILIELSQETLIPSPELAKSVLGPLDSNRVGVIYDPGNMIVEGNLAPAVAVALLGPLLKHVHAKNTIFRRVGGIWRDFNASVDSGLVDWRQVAAALREAGYDGWLAIDHLSGTVTKARLRSDIGQLREALKIS